MLAFVDRYQIWRSPYLEYHGIFFLYYVFCKWRIVAFLHVVAAVSMMCVYTLVLCAVIAMQSRRVCICSVRLSVCVSGVGVSKDSVLCMCVSACLFGLTVVCVCVWVVGAVSLGCYQPRAAVRQLSAGCQIIPVLYANVLLSAWFQEECTGLLNRGAQPAKPWLQQLREQLLFSSLSLTLTLSL